MITNKLLHYIKSNDYRFLINSNLGLYNRMDDIPYLKRMYKARIGNTLNLDCPKTFNEKLQWLKIRDRKPEYTIMVDKYLAKEYVSSKIGSKYIIPTLGLWKDFDDIDFEALPNQFVLKCTHDSGGIIICKDKNAFDLKNTKIKINRCLKKNFFNAYREWPYKNVEPQIIAEELMHDNDERNADHIRDYKFFCFNGTAKCFKIDFDRFINHRANYYSIDGSLLPFGEVVCPPDFSRKIDMPDHLLDMINLSECLSKNIPFLRVDFYEVSGSVYFGEMTFFPNAGFGRFTDDKWDLLLGDWLQL